MKKTIIIKKSFAWKKIALVFIGLAITAHNAFGQTNTMLNLIKYSEYFGFKNGKIDPGDYFVLSANRADRQTFAPISGNERVVDTPLEFALLSYYSQPVLNLRPAEADAILPKNNPKLADQKLGAAVFQEIQVLRFLGDTAAVSRHEEMLKWITNRKNATRQEIEAFYRDNVRALIAGVVDEEFGKKRISDETIIQIFSDAEKQGLVKDSSGKAVNGIALITETLTNFFLDPTQSNYENIRGIYAQYKGTTHWYKASSNAYESSIMALNETSLINKLKIDITNNSIESLTKIPSDSRFKIFSIGVSTVFDLALSFLNNTFNGIDTIDIRSFYTSFDLELELMKKNYNFQFTRLESNTLPDGIRTKRFVVGGNTMITITYEAPKIVSSGGTTGDIAKCIKVELGLPNSTQMYNYCLEYFNEVGHVFDRNEGKVIFVGEKNEISGGINNSDSRLIYIYLERE